jgi:hypothetical protein
MVIERSGIARIFVPRRVGLYRARTGFRVVSPPASGIILGDNNSGSCGQHIRVWTVVGPSCRCDHQGIANTPQVRERITRQVTGVANESGEASNEKEISHGRASWQTR